MGCPSSSDVVPCPHCGAVQRPPPTVSLDQNTILVDEIFTVRVPPQVAALMHVLAERKGQVVPYQELVGLLWGVLPPPTFRTALRVYANQLRRVLEDHSDWTVVTARGCGLRLARFLL